MNVSAIRKDTTPFSRFVMVSAFLRDHEADSDHVSKGNDLDQSGLRDLRIVGVGEFDWTELVLYQ